MPHPAVEPLMDNPRADRVRAVAALAGRPARRRTGTFLVEGPQSVREALRAHLGEGPAGARETWRPGQVLDQVFVAPDLGERHPELADLAATAARLPGAERVSVRAASAEVLAAMSDAVTAQGIVAVARMPRTLAGLDTAGAEGAPALSVALCRVQDPGNAGTILRAADAAGAGLVAFTRGAVDPFSPKVVRSTAGSLFHVRLATGVDLEETTSAARAAGVQVWAADGYGADRLEQLPSEALARPTLWLLGNEAQGLDAAERAVADRRVAVPLYGEAESLNVATAATVLLYASAMAARRT